MSSRTSLPLLLALAVFLLANAVGAYEELFTLDEKSGRLREAGNAENRTGDVSGFAPPGDIHRVRNAGEQTAISIHIYGTDVSRIGSSVRRYYELPVRPAASAA